MPIISSREVGLHGGDHGGRLSSRWFQYSIFVLTGRWFALFASFLIMAGAGATYVFGIYSRDIKETLKYNQTTLNLLSFFKDLGGNVGIFSGLLAEVTPTWVVLLIGSSMDFVGYFMIWLAITERIHKPKVWQMCLYVFLGANSQNFANTGALVTCVKNFPESRGFILGLLKGFAGLSGAIMTQVYLAIYGNNTKSLVLLIAWLPSAINLVFVYTIRTMKVTRQPSEQQLLYRFLYISIALALFLIFMTVMQKVANLSRLVHCFSAIAVCLLLLSPVVVVVKDELVNWRNSLYYPTLEEERRDECLSKEPSEGSSTWYDFESMKSSFLGSVFEKPDRGEDYTILQAVFSIDMAIIFVATMCGLGSSYTAVDNLGQIGESLGYSKSTISAFVSLISIWNYFGRVSAGFASESLLVKWKVPRPFMMIIVLLLPSVGYLLIAFPLSGSVYIASVVIGFSFGAQLLLPFAIISEIFGLKYYSTLFNFVQLAGPVGTYILNVQVTGMLYDREARKGVVDLATTKGELKCVGSHCYRMSFVILACVTCFGAFSSFILLLRTKEFYKGDIYKSFKGGVESSDNDHSFSGHSSPHIKDANNISGL